MLTVDGKGPTAFDRGLKYLNDDLKENDIYYTICFFMTIIC